MLWNPLQPRGIQRNAQSEVYAPDAWTDGDLRFRWTSEAGGVLEVSGIPGRPLPYQMSCPSPSEGRRWTPTLAGMLRAGRLPPEGVFRVSSQLPPPGSMDGRGGIVVGMYKGSGSEEWRTIRGHHILVKDGQAVNPPPWMKPGEHTDAPAAPAHHSHSLAAMGKVRDFLHGDPGASKLLKTPYKALVEGGACKTTGHCYAASEALYHYLGGKEAGWTPQSVQHEGGPHWFLKHKDGTVLDPTHDQFKTPVPVHQATGKGFLTKEPSKRAVAIMRASGLGGKEMSKGRHIVILSKGKKVSGPVAFLTDKTDGHVFPVSANSPKAAAALNTPRHREIAEKIHRETKDPGKKKAHAEHLASLGGNGGDNSKAEAPAAATDGGDAAPKASGPSVRERRWKPIAQAHKTKLRANHTASLLGQTVNTPGDLAELAQVYRDGRYETMRFFWMRGNQIAGHTGVSSRLAAQVSVKPFDVPDADFIPWIEKQKEMHGADSYFLLHNHPSGDPDPSTADLQMTHYVAERVQGFKAHVVINHGKYAVMEAYQANNRPLGVVRGQRFEFIDSRLRQLETPALEQATEEHDAIGKPIRGPADVAAVAKGLQAEKGWVTMIGIGARGVVNAITQVSADTYRHKARGRAAIRAFALSTGSARVVGAAPASENVISDEEIDERFRDGLLSDHITQEGDTYHSWREQNIWHDKKPDTDMGRVVSKSSRVTVQETLAKGRSIITILFKGKRITGPVAFLTNKEDGHVFPVSASDPKAVAAMNTPRHREIVEKIHAETTDPKKKAVHAEHLATLKKMAGEATPGHGLVIKPNTEKSFKVTGNTKEHDAALAGLKGASGDPYGSRQKNGDWVFSHKRLGVVEGLLKRLDGSNGQPAEKPAPKPAPAAVGAQTPKKATPAPAEPTKPAAQPSVQAFSVPKKSILSSAMQPTIKAEFLKGPNAVWFFQGDPTQMLMSGRTKFTIGGVQQPISPGAKANADVYEAARAGGYSHRNYRAGSYGTVWVMEKDGEILTGGGAASLAAGGKAGASESPDMKTSAPPTETEPHMQAALAKSPLHKQMIQKALHADARLEALERDTHPSRWDPYKNGVEVRTFGKNRGYAPSVPGVTGVDYVAQSSPTRKVAAEDAARIAEGTKEQLREDSQRYRTAAKWLHTGKEAHETDDWLPMWAGTHPPAEVVQHVKDSYKIGQARHSGHWENPDTSGHPGLNWSTYNNSEIQQAAIFHAVRAGKKVPDSVRAMYPGTVARAEKRPHEMTRAAFVEAFRDHMSGDVPHHARQRIEEAHATNIRVNADKVTDPAVQKDYPQVFGVQTKDQLRLLDRYHALLTEKRAKGAMMSEKTQEEVSNIRTRLHREGFDASAIGEIPPNPASYYAERFKKVHAKMQDAHDRKAWSQEMGHTREAYQLLNSHETRKRIEEQHASKFGTPVTSTETLSMDMAKGRAPLRQVVVMFKGDVASMEPLTTLSMSGRPRERRVGTEDDLRRRALSIRQRSREFIQRIHDGTQDPAKKAVHAARLDAYGPALEAPPGRQRKEKPFVGSIRFQGIPIAVENEKGTYREGIGRDGKPWRTKMNHHYGEIHGWGTVGTDGDKVDVYVGPNAEATHAYVVDQMHPDSGAFDEQKAMLGFDSEAAAKAAFIAQFDNPAFYGGCHPMPMDEFKRKIRDPGMRGQPITNGRPIVVLSKGRM